VRTDLSIDLTSIINSHIGKTLNLAIKNSADDNLEFASLESSNPPSLVISK